MQIILHLGAHCTDEDRLLRGMLRNAGDFRKEAVAIPGPGRYRRLLSETIHQLGDRAPAPEAREVLLDTMLDEDPDEVRRLVLSHENLLSVPKLILAGGGLYRKFEARLETMQRLFPGDEIRVFLGLRDFATFLPAAWQCSPLESFDAFLNGANPMHLRWSDFVARIASHVPVTCWCNEDTPLIWGQILREMAGVPLDRKIIGSFAMLSEIITPEGMRRFRSFLNDNPTVNEAQKRRVMTAFLDKYGLDDAIEQELDLPGWDAAYVDMLTEIYDEDVWQIGRMQNVTLITP
ncbi:hypothetical protein AL036_00005 [Salipiger aestuarii]|uniref:Uncharacterized protein n=1 Tax=Salipiger aestuarii TaxID=568098 RepID=A0A327YQ86_9RHOB|nr:hypothetical protein [Salipiger aestuarii]EIE48944.1 hypothetical protein C357_22330 [Citreicella sp. 357]KAA8610309.1 hypothetical protein AL036_00005 [Salipiger aestuarii]KAB2543582.1 hypothetical protein AL035_01985 [Salipiger aestuarii]RAK21845.1 hypothetical protein ATI53_10031 [Salipiger aestuarii]